MMEVTSLAAARGHHVARVLTNAFVDDPAWRDVGPSSALQRRLCLWCYYRSVSRKARRWGHPGYAALVAGRVAGIAVTFDWKAWPPPEPVSTLLDLPAFAVAGPFAAARAARAAVTIRRTHPREPHLFLWQLAVDPDVQRRGVGHALLARVAADADAAELPIYLQTANPDNVPYYRAHGFEPIGTETLPRGTPMWLMLRPSNPRPRPPTAITTQ